MRTCACAWPLPIWLQKGRAKCQVQSDSDSGLVTNLPRCCFRLFKNICFGSGNFSREVPEELAFAGAAGAGHRGPGLRAKASRPKPETGKSTGSRFRLRTGRAHTDIFRPMAVQAGRGWKRMQEDGRGWKGMEGGKEGKEGDTE